MSNNYHTARTPASLDTRFEMNFKAFSPADVHRNPVELQPRVFTELSKRAQRLFEELAIGARICSSLFRGRVDPAAFDHHRPVEAF